MFWNSWPLASDNLVTIICRSFSIVFVNNSLTTHLRSIFTRYPSHDYLWTLLLLLIHLFSHPLPFWIVYCSVSPLPPNYFPLSLANMYKHGPCTCTQSSISSVRPHPVFISFDIIRKAFLPTALQTSGIKQNHPIGVPLAPPTPAPFPLPSSSSSRTNTGH